MVVGSLLKLWAKIFWGMIVRKTNHEKTRIANQGAGFN